MVKFAELSGAGDVTPVLVESPEWAALRHLLDRLDGGTFSCLRISNSVSLDIPPWLQLVGGDQGRVACEFSLNGVENFLFLTDDQAPDAPVQLTVFGQEAVWPANNALPKSQVLPAVQYFFDFGGMSPELFWKNDTSVYGKRGWSVR